MLKQVGHTASSLKNALLSTSGTTLHTIDFLISWGFWLALISVFVSLYFFRNSKGSRKNDALFIGKVSATILAFYMIMGTVWNLATVLIFVGIVGAAGLLFWSSKKEEKVILPFNEFYY